MDRDITITINMLNAAKRGLLSQRQWQRYGCCSKDEIQTFCDILIGNKFIVEHKSPSNTATDGHGRVLIEFENDPTYSITRAGEQMLESLEAVNGE